jgi:hypothetical protein
VDCDRACIVLAATAPGASAKQPKPNDPGLLYCANNNDGSVGDIGKGGALRVCLTCDENWRNCKESFGARRSKLSTSPPSLEEAPKMDDSGFGTKLWGGNLGNEFRIEGGTQ